MNAGMGKMPEILLLHYTGTPTAQYAIDLLTTDAGQVSCHYLVHEDGRIVHMVDEDMRAWHAGASSWDGREDVNSRSIGIEIVNPGHGAGLSHDFPDAQIEAVIALSRTSSRVMPFSRAMCWHIPMLRRAARWTRARSFRGRRWLATASGCGLMMLSV
jgi:N-acetylmuramoyl-L-alanine amidase